MLPMRLPLLLVLAATTLTALSPAKLTGGSHRSPAKPGGSCVSSADCSLLGDCATDRRCVCDEGWTSENCSMLDLAPARWGPERQAYTLRSTRPCLSLASHRAWSSEERRPVALAGTRQTGAHGGAT